MFHDAFERSGFNLFSIVCSREESWREREIERERERDREKEGEREKPTTCLRNYHL